MIIKQKMIPGIVLNKQIRERGPFYINVVLPCFFIALLVLFLTTCARKKNDTSASKTGRPLTEVSENAAVTQNNPSSLFTLGCTVTKGSNFFDT